MKITIIAGIAAMGLLIIALAAFFIISKNNDQGLLGEVHEHADFRMYIHGSLYNFSQEEYMSSEARTLSNFIHLHDEDGEVIHKHASGITLGFFFNTLGMELDPSCLILANGTEYCNDDSYKLRMYVNGRPNNDFQNYEFKDLDQILMTYGDENESTIKQQIGSVSDNACIQSGNCPERGEPTDESSCATEGGCVAE